MQLKEIQKETSHLVEFIKKNLNPHCKIVITDEGAYICEDIEFMPSHVIAENS